MPGILKKLKSKAPGFPGGAAVGSALRGLRNLGKAFGKKRRKVKKLPVSMHVRKSGNA